MNMTRRLFLHRLAALAGTLSLSSLPGVSHAAGNPADDEVRIAYLPITDAAPLLVAHANGYFADEGLKAPRPVVVRSWSALSESFLTGKVNLTHLLLPIPVWMRYKLKFPVKMVAWDHTNGSAVTVGRDTGIRSFADLGGRQIAVPYWYSMHNVILQMGLRKVGLTPVIQPQSAPLQPNQVNLFILSPQEMPPALAAGKIDGFIVAEPFNALAEMKLDARILRFTGDIWQNHPCCVVVMPELVTRERPVFAQKVTNAIVRAQLWLTENPEEAAKMLSRDGKKYLPVTEPVLRRVFTGYELERYGPGASPQAIRHPDWPVRRIGFQPYPYPSATRFIIDEIKQTRLEGDISFLKNLDSGFVAQDLVADTFVKQAIREVGGAGRFGSVIDLAAPWQREEIIEL